MRPLTEFRQASPISNAEPSQRTEVRLAHDGWTLFVAVRAFDTDPSRIVARTMRRDAEAIDSDDHLALVLDPQGTGRNGFIFRINALGAQRDGIIFDGSITRPEWDALWDATARIDADGWSAELSIPLSALAAPVDGRPWHFNVERYVAATGERLRLFGAVGERDVDSLADAASLTGITPDQTSWGLRLQPALRWSTEQRGDGRRRSSIEPSLDAFYRLTPGVTATLTLNTDFSDTELDDRVVNLSRFELFRPEKRVFFTQDSGRFAFGGHDV